MICWAFFNPFVTAVILQGTVFDFDDSDFMPADFTVDAYDNVSTPFVATDATVEDPPDERRGIPIVSRLTDRVTEQEISAVVHNLQLMDFQLLSMGCEKVMARFKEDVVHQIERLKAVVAPYYAIRLQTALEYCTYITDNLPQVPDRPVSALQNYGSLRIRQLMQYLSDTRK